VRIVDASPEFPPREFEITEGIDPYPQGDWGNYVKAAAQALAGRFGSLRGVDGLVSSTIPIAAGLSSSSALVIAAALALLHASGEFIDRLELAELMADGERYVGLRGGGMDQAISLLAERNSASRIDFEPLRLTPIKVPEVWRLVIADSLERAPKAASAKDVYNRRVEECGVAAERVADQVGVKRGAGLYRRLLAQMSEEDLLFAAGRVLEGELHRRFRHVVTESGRVVQAQEAMACADATRFGSLMSESHSSLAEDYDVSTAALDRLVETSLGAGALGARLTGAGMGGCVVALADEGHVAAVLDALRDELRALRESVGDLEDKLFVAVPSPGASIEEIA
jgi:galactokinase